MSAVPGEVPQWLQYFSFVGIGLAALGAAVQGWRKGKPKPPEVPEGEARLVAGAIFDTNSMLALRDALKENTAVVKERIEESYRLRHALRDHCDCINENTDALKRGRRRSMEKGEEG